jgi:NADP-dependent 3-hydroxy acid dehydrogenase YdfG
MFSLSLVMFVDKSFLLLLTFLQMRKYFFQTGSSSGIGYETSLLFARNQITTYATMRNMGKSDGLREIASNENIPLNVTQLDVNNDSSVNDAITNIVKENGRIDILVNNAGYDLFDPLEESSLEEKIHLKDIRTTI